MTELPLIVAVFITNTTLSGCVLPMIIGNGFMVLVDDSHVCRVEPNRI